MVALKKGLRPTTAKVKEAIFKIIRDDIRDAHFLDLYAGTGAIGIEALRHGASEVVFVEASRGCVKNIQMALQRYGLSKSARIFNKRALSFISHIGTGSSRL